ncbi:MAG: DEAD/DEAH box helicase [Acidimicrobiales bacterium]
MVTGSALRRRVVLRVCRFVGHTPLIGVDPLSSSFSDLGVPAGISDRLAARGITEPFPIQAATLVDALAGRDVCGRAPTGSGKTIAFGIPLVAAILASPGVATTTADPTPEATNAFTGGGRPGGRSGQGRPGQRRGAHQPVASAKSGARSRRPTALVLVPTRELAAQVAAELDLLAGRGRPSVLAVYGGVGYGAQVGALRRGTDIVVACPGRLADLVTRGDIVLDDVAQVVVDEADRMADMGFLPEVRRLLDQVRPDRQTLLFSATLDGEVNALITRYQRDPVRHEMAADPDGPSNRNIFWKVDRLDRVDVTAGIVTRQWPALVFCRTKHGADRLAKQLGKAGVSAEAIHGDRSQAQRERALASFSTGKVAALVATDVAARGIHVDGVAAVVHFDLAGSVKDHVHRSGRTGRGGAAGLVVTLVDSDAKGGGEDMARRLGYRALLHTPDLDALASGTHDATSAPPGDSGPVRTSVRHRSAARPTSRRRTARGRR